MRCLLVIPVLAGLVFPPLAAAQHRSGPRSSDAGRPQISKSSSQRGLTEARRSFIAAATQTPVISKAGGAYSLVTPFQVKTRSAWEAPAPRAGLGIDVGKHHHRNQEFLFFNYSPLAYPYSYSNANDAVEFYPSLWAPLDQQYVQAWQIAHGDLGGEAAAPQQNDALSRQVQALTSEVESLRQEGSAQAPAAPQPAAQSKSVPTVFVYRDGHSIEVHNYAIFDQTLWVFGAATTRKIPLSAINLPATLKLNEDRGVDVSLPRTQ